MAVPSRFSLVIPIYNEEENVSPLLDEVHEVLAPLGVFEADRAAEADLVRSQLTDLDHLGPSELVVDVGDASGDVTLPLLGGVIFGILRQVAVGTRLLDLLDVVRPIHGLELLQRGLQLVVALAGHRNSVCHGSPRLAS